jgi:hypothetical protein
LVRAASTCSALTVANLATGISGMNGGVVELHGAERHVHPQLRIDQAAFS